MTDFGTVAPEINSARMHSGPGGRSMMAAATAWAVLGAQLRDTAVAYSELLGHAAAPHLAWLDATAARVERTAVQAKAAASAFGVAFAATVAPQAVNANRLQRVSLAATNFLGQSSPAIADVEADYEQMWAQDASAMYAYARASAAASTATPFTSPPSVTDSADPVIAASEVISIGCQVVSTISGALDALTTAPLTTLDASLSTITAPLSKLSSLSAPADVALGHLNFLNKTAALHSAAVLQAPRPRAGCGSQASRGGAASIGALSVPRSWAPSAPQPTWHGTTAGPIDRTQ